MAPPTWVHCQPKNLVRQGKPADDTHSPPALPSVLLTLSHVQSVLLTQPTAGQVTWQALSQVMQVK